MPRCHRAATQRIPETRVGQVGDAYLRNILQALQLVVLSNVYIWKLWWLALALSGLMFDLAEERIGDPWPGTP